MVATSPKLSASRSCSAEPVLSDSTPSLISPALRLVVLLNEIPASAYVVDVVFSKVDHPDSALDRAKVAVLAAEPTAAVALLQEAATLVLNPSNLAVVVAVAVGLIGLAQRLWQGSLGSRVAATTLITTLGVDGLFLALALNAPRWSGLI